MPIFEYRCSGCGDEFEHLVLKSSPDPDAWGDSQKPRRPRRDRGRAIRSASLPCGNDLASAPDVRG